MEQIYLDRDQCFKFSLHYFDGDAKSIRADKILSSKRQGYDAKHREYLQPFGPKTITIKRTKSDAPGWYRVQE